MMIATSWLMASAQTSSSVSDFGLGRARFLALLVAGICTIFVLAWILYARWDAGAGPPAYVTAPVGRRDISAQVTATGTLAPVVEVQVGSVVSGRIKELHADYNSEVRVGQVLARIDPQIFETAIDQAQGRLLSAQAELEQAEAMADSKSLEFSRLDHLARSGDVALAELDGARADWRTALAQVKVSRASIQQARANLEQAEVNLQYTTIRSPIDGIVVSRNVDVGQVVAASLQAPTIFVIAGELATMEVHTSVAESDVGQLAVGNRADFFVDAYPDETFRGRVKQVRYEAVTVSNVVTYDALIAVDNSELKLRPGMTANVNFIVQERHNAIVIPNRALRYQPTDSRLLFDDESPERPGTGNGGLRVGKTSAAAPLGHETATSDVVDASGQARLDSVPEARGRWVWKLRDGRPARIKIIVGISDGSDVEVIAGPLEVGDLIIVSEGESSGRENSSQNHRGPPRIF